MTDRTELLTDDAIALFLRTRSADADPGLLDDIVRSVGATPQERPWLGLGPINLPRRAVVLITVALLLATVGALAVGSGLFLPKPVLPLPKPDLGIFEPAAGRIVYYDGSDLWVIDPNAPSPESTNVRLDLEGTESDGHFASFTVPLGWSSDGTKLLFLRQDRGDSTFEAERHLYILHADGTETQVVPDPVEGAAISPDGEHVAFAADGLYVVDAEGGEPVRIAEEGNSPTFSPDGTQIAYLSLPRDGCCVEAGREHVWVANIDGTDAHEILADEPALARGVFELAWSPAGDRIAIENSLEDLVAIATFAPDGSDFRTVIDGGARASWSPDGSQIAFMRLSGGPLPGAPLALADADGSNVRVFDFGGVGPWHPGTPNGAEDRRDTPTASSGGMWPQTSLEEVRQAQERADAGDPATTWQLDAEILNGNPSNAEIVDRFLRAELGWEDYRFNPLVGWEQADTNLFYVRCAPGATNPLYPEDERYGGCAPTIDDFRYETVRIDLLQPVRTEPSGIWVVSQWRTTTPFAQSDPTVVDARATARLEDFLAARAAGQGAEGYVEVSGAVQAVPLMYVTTTGAPYERFEVERVGGPDWPYGNARYTIRLFADGGATVVEQPVVLRDGGLYLEASATTEDGQPLAVTHSFFSGAVTFAAAEPWSVRGGLVDWGALTTDEWWSSASGIELALCGTRQAPDAEALAQTIRAAVGQAATTPVAVNVGGVEGFLVDATIDAELSVCGGRSPSLEVVTRGALSEGIRIRYELLDLPDGSSPRILVIAIAAPEADFDAMIDAATPIVDSIELHAR